MKLSLTLEEAKILLNAAHEIKHQDHMKPLLPPDEIVILEGIEKKLWRAMSDKQVKSFRPLKGVK